MQWCVFSGAEHGSASVKHSWCHVRGCRCSKRGKATCLQFCGQRVIEHICPSFLLTDVFCPSKSTNGLKSGEELYFNLKKIRMSRLK